MSERVEAVMKAMLVANLQYFLSETDDNDEAESLRELVDAIKDGTASDDQLIEAMQIISAGDIDEAITAVENAKHEWPVRWWEPGCEDINNAPEVDPDETWIPDEIVIELPFE